MALPWKAMRARAERYHAAQAAPATEYPELADECPQCGGASPVLLGLLGRLAHYRCRACGWTFSQ